MEIRRIEAKAVTDTVKELFLRCNYEIGQDILDALSQARERGYVETLWHRRRAWDTTCSIYCLTPV